MIQFTLSAAVLLALLLASCVTGERMTRLEPGMSKHQVIDILGRPDGLVSTIDHKTPALESIEKAYIHWVLEQSGGNKSTAARILGIDASTLYRKLEKYSMGMTRRKGRADQKQDSEKGRSWG